MVTICIMAATTAINPSRIRKTIHSGSVHPGEEKETFFRKLRQIFYCQYPLEVFFRYLIFILYTHFNNLGIKSCPSLVFKSFHCIRQQDFLFCMGIWSNSTNLISDFPSIGYLCSKNLTSNIHSYIPHVMGSPDHAPSLWQTLLLIVALST